MRFIYWLRTLWRTFWWPMGGTSLNGNFKEIIICSGHDFVEYEAEIPAYVNLQRCEDCGKHEVVWRKRND